MSLDLSPSAIEASLSRLRLLRNRLARSAPKPDPEGSLVPLLTASAEVGAVDVAIRLLEGAMKEAVS